MHAQNGAALIDALTTVLRNVTKEETVQYVLALLDDIVTREPLLLHVLFKCIPISVPRSYPSCAANVVSSWCLSTAAVWLPLSIR